jgi:predicted nucleic acid-binding protein
VIVVSDTSPVRGLIAIGKVILLHQLFNKVILPKAVEAELLRVHALKNEVTLFISEPWVEIQQIQMSEEYFRLRKVLDQGESEAIILSKQLHAEILLMDENKGRRLAQEMNIKVLGLMGVLIKAKNAGLIAALKPELDKLIHDHGFWIQGELYRNILLAANESQ